MAERDVKHKHMIRSGWTKASLIQYIRDNFKGKSMRVYKDGSVSTNLCAYKGPDGKKCAVGLFIPDDQYRPIFEGDSAISVMRKVDVKWPLSPDAMACLQAEHDDDSQPAETILDRLVDWVTKYVVETAEELEA